MRVFAAVALIAAVTAAACGGAGLFRQYEYEEEMYLSLDNTATVYVNSSIAALNALRGTSFDTNPLAPVDRAAVRDYFSSPITHVKGSVTTSRRNNRRFVHVRVDVDDVTRLGEAAPFAWSSYRFNREDDLYVYRQTVGAPARKDVGQAGWTGHELVAFRLHIPSKVTFQNTGPPKRGNILVWEQTLSDRLKGEPLTLEAKMESQSILYRTLWLFGATFLAVAVMFGAVIWWVLRRGARDQARADLGARPRADT
jgi:hypothetical protein